MAHPQKTQEASTEPEQTPEVREKVELARTFAFHLLKGIKQIGMYRHNDARFPEFLAKALESITQYTEKYGPLSLKVEQQNLTLHNDSLFTEDTPLPYKFFRDGIRQLIFRPGLVVEELVTFTMISLSEPERGAEDVLAQLWRAGMEHVEYVVVEGFSMENASEDEVQVEVDKVVGYLYARLQTNSDDYLRFARVSAEDLDAKLDGVEQIRGLVVGGRHASDDLKAKLQREVSEEEGARLFPKLVSAVFQVVEGGVEDGALLEEIFVQLLDMLLLQDDFGTINQIVLKLRALSQKEGGAPLEKLLESFLHKMGEEQRLMRLGESLKGSRPKHPADVTRYLQALGRDSVIPLLTVLETLEIPENRALLCDALAVVARELPEPFVARLISDRPQTVRDMVYVLEKSNHPERIKMFGQVLKSPNLVVKLEVLNIIGRGRTGEARRLIFEALADPVSQVRMVAARMLPEFDRDKAFSDLMRLIREPAFDKKTPDERTAFYAAVGATGTPGALSHMQQLLAVKPSLLNKKRVLEDKMLAVAGLQGACSIQSYKMMQAIVEDRTQPVELLTAARKAMYQTRKTLFGDSALPEEA
ncbi:HEAT repeat domain-containing protein [Myxococcus llanfairpwllgwyngyllgogerychwyrndrobwllllantysiliogogogochensis]|uniref:HEAT repeat domain-containing protein n=1 Tax=Myxococcus llanfairpwllgwyngyllgogerychwyrndrobwllllantysiliogogogochensis TaxID=2590453 RepID=A0A540WPS6_9BACT|nr:HEAT repeat domain-containing protein [Myxococcus llanfairpwllgwyngyllgogerychwyrndrobwllllantysiliogogogochensis]TQF11009.1 HEAT repeat domain-containing protein [Myxococcus llanfairpwllgwyngyllgogerychwyrndrobwllllantysiliogogogochensis]